MWPRGWVEVYLYSSMTAAQKGGEWSAARPDRTLPPGKTRHPLYRRLGGPQGRSGRAENLVPTGIRSRTVQPEVSRYTDWATRSTLYNGCQVFPGGNEWPRPDADPSPPSSAVVKKEQSYTSTPPMGRKACTEPQCLYKGALYLYLFTLSLHYTTTSIQHHHAFLIFEHVLTLLGNRASLFYLTNIACHLTPLQRLACGQPLNRLNFIHFSEPTEMTISVGRQKHPCLSSRHSLFNDSVKQ